MSTETLLTLSSAMMKAAGNSGLLEVASKLVIAAARQLGSAAPSAVAPEVALRDLRLTEQLLAALTPPLKAAGWNLEVKEAEDPMSSEGVKRQFHLAALDAVGRRSMLHIAREILDDDENEANCKAVRDLGWMFERGSILVVFSPNLDVPAGVYVDIARVWEAKMGVRTVFVPWRRVREMVKAKTSSKRDTLLQEILAIAVAAQPDPAAETPLAGAVVPTVVGKAGIMPKDKELVEVLVKLANGAPPSVGVKGFFRDLVLDLPDGAGQEVGGIWTGSATYDAKEFMRWARSKGVNQADPKWTTLGALLKLLLPRIGLDDAALLVAYIDYNRLCRDDAESKALRARYMIPVWHTSVGSEWLRGDFGPDFVTKESDVELQAFLKAKPSLMDVGFLSRAIRRAASVCRVEFDDSKATGTGVLVGSDLVLTNHHVMTWDDAVSAEDSAKRAVLRFGYIDADPGKEAAGQTFRLAAERPIEVLDKDLDFALLRVEAGLTRARGVEKAPFAARAPAKGSGLHVLQHPLGETMKLAVSEDGISAVFDNGFVQYVTNCAHGSSGAPCFNDEWELVALHRAERSRPFGKIGEGILMSSIRNKCNTLLP